MCRSVIASAQRRSNLLFASALSTIKAYLAKSAAFAEQNRQILYIAPFWKLLYTCCRVAEHMYIIFQVLRFAQNLQRCARLSLFCRLSFCAPEPRDITLHAVCCMETLYVSLRDSNKQNVFEPHSSPCAFVHTPKQCNVVHSLQDLPLGKSWRFVLFALDHSTDKA